jgi:hypothetical protein
MRPAVDFYKADQTRLRQLKLERSQVLEAGRLMFCRGRSIIGYGHVGRLANFNYIPKNADTICLSPADFDDVREWIG